VQQLSKKKKKKEENQRTKLLVKIPKAEYDWLSTWSDCQNETKTPDRHIKIILYQENLQIRGLGNTTGERRNLFPRFIFPKSFFVFVFGFARVHDGTIQLTLYDGRSLRRTAPEAGQNGSKWVPPRAQRISIFPVLQFFVFHFPFPTFWQENENPSMTWRFGSRHFIFSFEMSKKMVHFS